MVQLTLPQKSRIKAGKTWPKPAAAKRLTEFRIYRWNPDDGRQSASRHVFRRSRGLRADGPRRADLDQIEDRFDVDLPPLLPRGRLRLVRDEHRRAQHARLHPRHRRGRRAGLDLSPAPPGGDQGPGSGPHDLLRAARLDRALAEDHDRRRRRRNGCNLPKSGPSSTGSTSASSARAAQPPVPATGGTATAISAQQFSCRPTVG